MNIIGAKRGRTPTRRFFLLPPFDKGLEHAEDADGRNRDHDKQNNTDENNER